ncbi:MAG: helix-turn-helix domain-containing protein [Phycisphaerales bacterium]|nr:MAG: helix-turn-helix domain-containing protein [Phycisphaerales bacterium]
MDRRRNETFSPNQVARSLGVSEASIKRWCDKGILSFTKTAGGHRRIPVHVVLDFVRENDFTLAQPEVLGLPPSVGLGSRTLRQACRLYGQALEQGDELQCLQLTLDLRLAGHDMAVIGDRVIAPAFYELGQRWQHGEAEVYQERRGVEITRHVLSRLKDSLAPPVSAAPTAIGATPLGDPYSLPGQLCELVLLELGWQARFLGSELPMETVTTAVEDLHPRVLWLSVSVLEDPEGFVLDYRPLYELCLKRQCAVVVGGRALTGSLRRQLKYASYCDNLSHLRGFAHSLWGAK